MLFNDLALPDAVVFVLDVVDLDAADIGLSNVGEDAAIFIDGSVENGDGGSVGGSDDASFLLGISCADKLDLLPEVGREALVVLLDADGQAG